jgi:DNA modification methylase
MKSVEDLIKSRQQRAAILAAFGEIPQSIMRHKLHDKAIDFHADGSYRATKNDGGYKGKLGNAFDVSNQGNEALSRFPQNIGRSLLLLYTKENHLVIDPFAGHNSRMELCWRNNRHYAGNDLSADFYRDNLKIAEMLKEEAATDLFSEHFTAQIRLYHGDSRQLPFGDAEGDFTMTSPPYYDQEYYGDEPEQLGRAKTYAEFVIELTKVARENYRVLAPGAFCVWFVNDFRKDGVFYSFHEDTASMLRAAGFVQFDILIVDLGAPIRAAFAQQVIETKILPKRHEYGLVFRKPGGRPERSLYDDFEIGASSE